jgi:predicted Zn-dependent protease with MMP-like domain
MVKNPEAFQKLLGQALEELPEELRAEVGDSPVLVRDVPPPDCPPSARMAIVQHGQRVRIEVYKNGFDSPEKTEEQIRDQLRAVLLDELGFYFGQ